MNTVKVGDSLCYPSSYLFEYTFLIPESVARQWLVEREIYLKRDLPVTSPEAGWLNKLALCVEVVERGYTLWVYKHDDNFWILKGPEEIRQHVDSHLVRGEG